MYSNLKPIVQQMQEQFEIPGDDDGDDDDQDSDKEEEPNPQQMTPEELEEQRMLEVQRRRRVQEEKEVQRKQEAQKRAQAAERAKQDEEQRKKKEIVSAHRKLISYAITIPKCIDTGTYKGGECSQNGGTKETKGS
jgi:hypothetical protein